MKRRIADLLADTLVAHGITDLFSVVGGGAMFLNDAFGHHEKINVTYNNHEQACAIAAEGYVRACGKMAAVCVTTGPGGTNALTGVLGAYQDNYPMIVISGQVKMENCIASTGLALRFLGEQEHNIVATVKPLTKYAVMVTRPEDAVYELEKALYLANTGRRGPCWIDVPLNIQGGYIEENEIRRFIPEDEDLPFDMDLFVQELKNAKRPVILTGSALRSTGCLNNFIKLIEILKIPVLAATYNADLFSTDHPYYFGNFGVNGGRCGNFIVQNADLIIGMGCRMAYRQIGFNYKAFAPNARKMIIDVDANELKKPSLAIDVPIRADIEDVVQQLSNFTVSPYEDTCGWLAYCRRLKNQFPVYMDKFNTSDSVNPYFFIREIKKILKKDTVIVLGNSSIAGHVLQMGISQQGQRIINNMNCGSMGYDLPAALGAAKATGKEILLITGDGSLQMNLQELATMVHYNLPIKIFVCNNGGYRAIVRTQRNFFEGRYTGCSPETGVGLPEMSRIADAYRIPYTQICNHKELPDKLTDFLSWNGYGICEIMQDYEQMIEPRIMSKKMEDGTLVSPPLDDLFPFLDEETYKACQFR